jgi:D-glycero-alpha-D-manno-heptose-7-phosphate kinase
MKLVRVPLRISFVGGGSDLPSHYEKYGGAVISCTINQYIYITAKQNTGLFPHKYRLVYSQVEELNDRFNIKHPIIRCLTSKYNVTNGLDLDVMSDVPAGTGLGSSSAFTVGLHAALGNIRNKHTLAELACETEITDLREPIGKQDQYAAAFGGLNYFVFHKDMVEVRPIIPPVSKTKELEECLTLVYVGGNRSASALLKTQNLDTKNLDNLRVLAKELYLNLLEGNIGAIGHYIAEGWELKKKLSPNVSNERIDTIINTALDNGATGGKLLGAGSCGFVLLFHPIGEKYRMLEALKPLNLNYVPFEFDNEGCKVLYE